MRHTIRVRLLSRLLCIVLVLVMGGVTGIKPPRSISVAAPALSPVQIENNQTGSTGWQLTNPTSTDIAGYASAVSMAPGGSIDLMVSTTAPSFTMDVYRMGWYGGAGGRLVDSIGSLTGVVQPACPESAATLLIACAWTPSYTLQVPATWVSGVYLVHLITSTGYDSYIMFVVRSAAPTTYLVDLPVNTFQAYNGWGGESLYNFNSTNGPATQVSFDRPYDGGGHPLDTGSGEFFNYCYHLIRWLERTGYDVSYTTDADVDSGTTRLTDYHGLIIGGHSEYWAPGQHTALDEALAAGVNVAVLSSDTSQWAIRYEPDAAGTPDRVIDEYRIPPIDPLFGVDNSRVTTMYRTDPLDRPENADLGEMYLGIITGTSLTVPFVATNTAQPVYSGTGLHPGDSINGLIYDEADGVVNNGAAPVGLTILSASPYESSYCYPAVSNAVTYTVPGGGTLFNSSSWNFNLFLDHYTGSETGDARVQVMVANELAQMTGAGPTGDAPSLTLTDITTSPVTHGQAVSFSAAAYAPTGISQVSVLVNTATDGSASGQWQTMVTEGAPAGTRFYSSGYPFNTGTLAPGLHPAMLSATDASGNALPATPLSSWEFQVNAPPVAPFLRSAEKIHAERKLTTGRVSSVVRVASTPAMRVMTASAGSTTQLVVSMPQTVASGQSTSVTVTAEDASGNVTPSYTSTVHFASSDPAASLPADYTFTPADAGTHTFSLTLNTVTSQTVSATDTAGGISGVAGTQVGVGISAGWNMIDAPINFMGLNYASGIACSIHKNLSPTGPSVTQFLDASCGSCSTATSSSQLAPVSMVATYANGAYSLYVPGYSSPNLQVAPGQGVFVLSTSAGIWEPVGQAPTSAAPIQLNPGWNIVAAPYPSPGLYASKIASEATCGVSEVVLYGSSGYQTWTPGSAADLFVPATNGIWLLCQTAGSWTPT